MATNKNITMKQFNGVDYDTLYPKTIASQIDDVYSKDEMSNLFLPKAGGSMGGILDMNGNRITNLPTPTSNSDPATKEYVDGRTSKWVKVSNLTLNNKTSGSLQKPLGSFNTFSLDNINAVRGVRFKGDVNIPSMTSGDFDGGLTLFSPYNYACLYLVKYIRDYRASYVFPIDIVIPAILLNEKDSSDKLVKKIYIPTITYTENDYTSKGFSGVNPPAMYNSVYSWPISCNIDMYLEVVE